MRLRLILMMVCGIGGAAAFFYDYWLSAALWVSAMILMLMHFRFGPIVHVLRALGAGDVDGAEALLNGIKRPDWLAKAYQAYYHFARGLVAYRRNEVEVGKQFFLKAMSIGLPGKYERSITSLNLAHAYYIEKDKTKTLEYLQMARDTQSDDLFLKQRIEELDKAVQALE